MTTTFPFAAIVGQEEMKLGLLLNALNPAVGGILIRGEKGTGKSTAVRSLAELLPVQEVSTVCRFGCDPSDTTRLCSDCLSKVKDGEQISIMKRKMRVVELPLSVTEDRLIGSLNINKAIRQGEVELEPGILALANRNILYVDEINLLDDTIVNDILDVAAQGLNIIEREGISRMHPSNFILVGTMNPEEGELRPQILDRLGLVVEVGDIKDADQRSRIINYRERFDLDPEDFYDEFREEQKNLTQQVIRARSVLPKVVVSTELRGVISTLCIQLGVASLRGDLTLLQAAKANAALEGRLNVELKDIRRVAGISLTHRIKNKPFERPVPLNPIKLEDTLNQILSDGGISFDRAHWVEKGSSGNTDMDGKLNAPLLSPHSSFTSDWTSTGKIVENTAGGEVAFLSQGLDVPSVSLQQIFRNLQPNGLITRKRLGSRVNSVVSERKGRALRAKAATQEPRDISILGSVRKAAVRLATSRSSSFSLATDDLMENVRSHKVPLSVCIAFDNSSSMEQADRMQKIKGVAHALISDIYNHKDKVGFVTYDGLKIRVISRVSKRYSHITDGLKELPTSASSPLASAIVRATELLDTEASLNPSAITTLIVFTDGKMNIPLYPDLMNENKRYGFSSAKIKSDLEYASSLAIRRTDNRILIDFRPQEDYGHNLARTMDAFYYSIDELMP